MKRMLGTSFLSLLLMGCVASGSGMLGPKGVTVQISGTVTTTDGTPVWMAKVSTLRGDVFTNQVGVFHLSLPASFNDVTIQARDGYTPGRVYAVTHFGSATVRPDRDRVVGIVLRYSSPI